MAFKPGQSGNPSGRPKVDFEVRQLAREYGQEAIEKLVAIMRGDNPALAKAASEALLDRGYGKPVQSVGVDPDSVPVQGITVHFVSPRATREDCSHG
ncbi:hypothetical protein DXT57_07825 [Stenotrophomonas maltophilia]|uniref:DUF5681 domain-containing protein n=1 Tax=Stenotrophomonas maltophilia TaxID=40324 RepID=UPI000E22921E|nr:DUF5681 domain-containing protein [Stenotrophomonas maltophilia]REC87101.1 hypothetical protein DXT57_07825 [Stenotrophomonas maltophilia]